MDRAASPCGEATTARLNVPGEAQTQTIRVTPIGSPVGRSSPFFPVGTSCVRSGGVALVVYLLNVRLLCVQCLGGRRSEGLMLIGENAVEKFRGIRSGSESAHIWSRFCVGFVAVPICSSELIPSSSSKIDSNHSFAHSESFS